MPVERVLITVKTYPTLSKTYGETVCTAGLTKDGNWIRIYPIPFRRIEDLEKRYHKYEWIECDLVRNTAKDKRPESRRPADIDSIRCDGRIGTENQWRERRTLILEKGQVFTNMQELIEDAKADKRSLATFKPKKVIDFVVEQDEREWDEKKLDEIRKQLSQHDLFENNEWRKTFKVVDKLPYKFSYRFSDDTDQERTLMILDWELGALFWKYGRDDEELAIQKVRQKYFDEFVKTDLHFFLGTTRQWHSVAPNPWVIIGVAQFPFLRAISSPHFFRGERRSLFKCVAGKPDWRIVNPKEAVKRVEF